MSLLHGECAVAIVSFVLNILACAGVYNPESCAEFHIYIYIALAALNFIREKRVTLFHMWILGYVYIIWSDIIINCHVGNTIRYTNSINLLSMANSLFCVGYVFRGFFYTKSIDIHIKSEYSIVKNRFLIVMLIALVTVCFFKYKGMIANLSGGRQLSNVTGSGVSITTFINVLALIVPTLFAFYFVNYSNRNKWWSLIFFIPVFVLHLYGSRFRLLYILIPYLIILDVINIKSQKIKTIGFLIILAFALSYISSFIKVNRNSPIQEVNFDVNQDYGGGYYGFAKKMSPEGIVRMTYYADRWFASNEHSYGREIGFAFYFVIPRAVWPSKPVPIDHWLIRKYEIVPDSASTSSGFTGEIRADFGYFCMVIVFLWGMILRWLDNKIIKIVYSDSISYFFLYLALLYPFVFFFVRSPLTSFHSLILEILLVQLIFSFCRKKT